MSASNIFPGAPLREAPNPTGYPQIPSLTSLQYGLQETLTDLLADRPKLEKGLDQMLELLNLMVAGGGAEQIARTMAAATQLPGEDVRSEGAAVRDPRPAAAPASPTSIRPPTALPPVLEQAGSDAECRRPAGRWGRTRRWHGPCADLRGKPRRPRELSDQLSTLVAQTRAPVVGFAQSGLPSLQGLIQDMDRAVSEVSRTVRDLRQNPSQFLLGDPAAQGVKLQ